MTSALAGGPGRSTYPWIMALGVPTLMLLAVLVDGCLGVIRNTGGLSGSDTGTIALMLGLLASPSAVFLSVFTVTRRRYDAAQCAVLASLAATLPATVAAVLCTAWVSVQW